MEPTNGQLILQYGVEMTITLLIAFGLYLLRVQMSPTGLREWMYAHVVSIGICFAVSWLLAVGIVVSPNLSGLLGQLGFNASQNAAAMALVLAGFVIGATAKPTAT